MKLFRVVLGLALCGGIALPLFIGHAGAVDLVTARITCPPNTSVRLDWKDKIGSDPPFSVWSGETTLTAPFAVMSRHGQEIRCAYQIRQGMGYYRYVVQRAIQSCTKVSSNVMDCVVKK
jgi:hypothetical protein